MNSPANDGARAHLGCHIVNTIFNVGLASDAVQTNVSTYRSMLSGAFMTALTETQNVGDITLEDLEIEAVTKYCLTNLLGALATIRLEGHGMDVGEATRVACNVIDGWAKK